MALLLATRLIGKLYRFKTTGVAGLARSYRTNSSGEAPGVAGGPEKLSAAARLNVKLMATGPLVNRGIPLAERMTGASAGSGSLMSKLDCTNGAPPAW